MLHENTLGETYFAPLTEKTVYEKGFKSWHDNANRALEDIRGEASGAPLAYIIHPNIHPLPEADEPEANFDTFDEQLIARKPIVKHARRNAPRRTVRVLHLLGSALKLMRTIAGSMH